MRDLPHIPTRLIACLAMALCICAQAIHPAALRAADVFIVKASDAEPYTNAETALRERLTAAHHTVRSALAKEVSDKGLDATVGKADIVVAVGTSAARWLHKTLPAGRMLVYCMVNNADDAGLMQGAPCYGVTTDVGVAEQLKLLAETVPKGRRIGALYRSDAPESKDAIAALSAALPSGWQLDTVAVNDFPSIAAAIDALTQKKVDVIWTAADAKLYDTAAVRALLLSALRSKIPVWGFSPAFVRAGALVGIGVDPKAQGEQAAALALRLIADPQSVNDRVQPPREFQIAVNLIVAEQIGVEVPEAVSRRASFVFRPEK